MVTMLYIFKMSLRREFKQLFRYKANLILSILNTAIFTLLLLLFLPLYTNSSIASLIGTTNPLGYVLIGVVFLSISNLIWSSRFLLQNELQS